MRPQYTNLDWIKQDLTRTRKALIVLGCSFAQGKAAYDAELVAEHRPRRREHWGDCDYQQHDFTKTELEDLSKKYRLPIHDNYLWTADMEHSNSFGCVLAEKILDKEWTPIILASQGKGNWSNIDRLGWLPIRWESVKEIKVVWSITDLVRTDLFTKPATDFNWLQSSGNNYSTFWPFDVDTVSDFEREWGKKLAQEDHDPGLKHFFASNWIKNLSSVHNWCKAHKADLVMFDAFCQSYETTDLRMMFAEQIERNPVFGDFIKNLPWESKMYPGEERTFFNMCMAQETSYEYKLVDKHNMWEFVEIPEEEISCEWIMPCGHPSAKGHQMLAEILYKRMFN